MSKDYIETERKEIDFDKQLCNNKTAYQSLAALKTLAERTEIGKLYAEIHYKEVKRALD